MSIQTSIKPLIRKKVIITSIHYQKAENSSINSEHISVSTTENRFPYFWEISDRYQAHHKAFVKARHDILSGTLTKGKEITLIFSTNGFLYFEY